MRADAPFRIAIGANFNALRVPYAALLAEFAHVIAECDEARLVAPEGMFASPGADTLWRAASQVLHRTVGRRLPSIAPPPPGEDSDLFVFLCPFLHDLNDLPRFDGWRRRARKSAVFVLESWSSRIAENRAAVRLLNDVDHVFLLVEDSLPAMRAVTTAPCSFLPVAADAVTFAPGLRPPRRVIDVYAMGRRAPAFHAGLRDLANAGRIFYQHDTTRAGTVLDWRESRRMTADWVRRTKLFMAFDHMVGNAGKAQEAASERALSMRYFEGAAGGAVMFGSAPPCASFKTLFDWTDALIEVPEAPADVADVILPLLADQDRLDAASRLNVANTLARHDWSHRWAEILSVCGLAPHRRWFERQATLEDMRAAATGRMPVASAPHQDTPSPVASLS